MARDLLNAHRQLDSQGIATYSLGPGIAVGVAITGPVVLDTAAIECLANLDDWNGESEISSDEDDGFSSEVVDHSTLLDFEMVTSTVDNPNTPRQ
jgi:hypothetical protein